MKIFITGASGFVGACAVRVATQAGDEVFAAVRPGNEAPRLADCAGKFQRVDLDLRDERALRAALLHCKPEVVIHLGWAGVSNSMRFDRSQIEDNIAASCALVEAAADACVGAFIGIGSQGEYGASSDMLETNLPQPTTLYGAAKVATSYLTRQLAQKAGMRHAWLRLFSTYGPHDNEGWLIPFLIDEMLAGRRPRTTLGTQYWDWLYVDDVARGILAAARSPDATGVFNLGSGRAVQVRSVVERVRDLIAPDLQLVFGEIPFRPDQVMFMQADISRLCAATGWEPLVAIEEGLSSTVEWRRSRGAWR